MYDLQDLSLSLYIYIHLLRIPATGPLLMFMMMMIKMQKSSKNRPQIDPHMTPNRPEWELKSVPEALLGGSGGHLGTKSEQDLKMLPKNLPKMNKKSQKIR